MLNSNESETHLSREPCYKYVTQTIVNTNEPETYFRLISHITQTMLTTSKPETHLSHKPRYEFVT